MLACDIIGRCAKSYLVSWKSGAFGGGAEAGTPYPSSRPERWVISGGNERATQEQEARDDEGRTDTVQ